MENPRIVSRYLDLAESLHGLTTEGSVDGAPVVDEVATAKAKLLSLYQGDESKMPKGRWTNNLSYLRRKIQEAGGEDAGEGASASMQGVKSVPVMRLEEEIKSGALSYKERKRALVS